MEIWDIYDNNRIKTGKTHVRGEKMVEGDNILIVMILIFDKDGRMLSQQRPMDMTWGPGKWTMTAGGAVQAGETPSQAAERELYEELGIKMDFAGARPNFTMTNDTAFIDYFLVRADIDLATLSVPNEEVAGVKWVSKEEMLSMVDSGESMNYRKSFLEFCFDCADMMECTLAK